MFSCELSYKCEKSLPDAVCRSPSDVTVSEFIPAIRLYEEILICKVQLLGPC